MERDQSVAAKGQSADPQAAHNGPHGNGHGNGNGRHSGLLLEIAQQYREEVNPEFQLENPGGNTHNHTQGSRLSLSAASTADAARRHTAGVAGQAGQGPCGPGPDSACGGKRGRGPEPE